LDWDIEPENDLWPQVSSKMRFAKNRKKKRYSWSSAAVATSLVCVLASLFFSFKSYQRSNQLEQNQALMLSYQQAQLTLIEQQHQMVRVQFLAVLESQSDDLDPSYVTEIKTLMSNIDQASVEIKEAISLQPSKPDYASLLVTMYQQESKALKRFKELQGLSI
jgi:hypothetical protein